MGGLATNCGKFVMNCGAELSRGLENAVLSPDGDWSCPDGWS